MMQLYINGIAVDMPADEIKIKVTSNLFADVSKVMSAHSYNIALPRTMANDALFALAFMPSADTGGVSTHTYLPASLTIDGIPIFEDGKALITSVTKDGYNVNLFWGVIDVLNEIKEEDLKLNALPLSKHWDEATMATWVELPHRFITSIGFPSGMDDTIYATLSSEGKDEADKWPWQMPVISANDILTKITQVYGVTFNFSPSAAASVNNICHPLVTLNIMCDDEKPSGTLHAGIVTVGARTSYEWLHLIDTDTPKVMDDLLAVDEGFPFYPNHDSMLVFDSCHIHGRAHDEFYISYTDAWQNGCTTPDAATWDDYHWRYPSTLGEDGWYHINVEFFNVTANGNTEWKDRIPRLEVLADPDQTLPELECNFVISQGGEIQIGDQWCFERNYPDLKVLSYINELLAHIGAFVVGSIGGGKVVNIATYDEVITADPIKLDTQGISNVEMSLSDIAQRNIYTHKENEDDKMKYTASAEIECADVTLDDERTAFSSDFKVPRTNLVRLWEVEAQDGGENMARWVANGNYIAGYLERVDFGAVLQRHYRNYSRLIYWPKVVTANVHLSVLELLSLDFTKPIYINQAGRSYIVLTLENDGGEIYKLKLIQI